MRITIIAAMGINRVIGHRGNMPWLGELPADLAHFKARTLGKPVVMGRKTWDSIPAIWKPLPGRTNIVLTRERNFVADGVLVAHTMEEVFARAKGAAELMVAGGEQIYKEFLPLATHLELTIVEGDFPGDTYFPYYNPSDWRIVDEEEHERDGRNKYDYKFRTLERR